jgi:hypothetical protein
MDYNLESTFDYKFTSRAFATGIPTALASGVVEIYENNDATQITGAETLTVDFDSIVGYNNLRVVATTANGFEAGKSYAAVLSTGTVGGVSVVGETILNFNINRIVAASVTGAVGSVAGAVGSVTGAVGSVTGAVGSVTGSVGSLTGHTVQTGDNYARIGAPVGASLSADIAAIGGSDISISSSVNDTTPAAGNFTGAAGLNAVTDDFYENSVLVFTSGTLQGISRRITSYTASSLTIVFDDPFPVAPADADTFKILGRIE